MAKKKGRVTPEDSGMEIIRAEVSIWENPDGSPLYTTYIWIGDYTQKHRFSRGFGATREESVGDARKAFKLKQTYSCQ